MKRVLISILGLIGIGAFLYGIAGVYLWLRDHDVSLAWNVVALVGGLVVALVCAESLRSAETKEEEREARGQEALAKMREIARERRGDDERPGQSSKHG